MAAIATSPAGSQPALGRDLCWLLSRASHALMTEFSAALEAVSISPRAHAVMSAAQTGEHTQTELARLVGLDKTTMVVTVDELEAAGLADRVPDPHDRRARVIRVTTAGRRRLAEAEEILDRVREDVLAGLPESDREVFLRCLAQLASTRLSEPVPCAHPVRRRA